MQVFLLVLFIALSSLAIFDDDDDDDDEFCELHA